MQFISTVLALLNALALAGQDPVPTATALLAATPEAQTDVSLGVVVPEAKKDRGAAWIWGGAAAVGGIAILASNDGGGHRRRQSVPEPASCAVLAVGAAALVRRRKARSIGN